MVRGRRKGKDRQDGGRKLPVPIKSLYKDELFQWGTTGIRTSKEPPQGPPEYSTMEFQLNTTDTSIQAFPVISSPAHHTEDSAGTSSLVEGQSPYIFQPSFTNSSASPIRNSYRAEIRRSHSHPGPRLNRRRSFQPPYLQPRVPSLTDPDHRARSSMIRRLLDDDPEPTRDSAFSRSVEGPNSTHTDYSPGYPAISPGAIISPEFPVPHHISSASPYMSSVSGFSTYDDSHPTTASTSSDAAPSFLPPSPLPIDVRLPFQQLDREIIPYSIPEETIYEPVPNDFFPYNGMSNFYYEPTFVPDAQMILPASDAMGGYSTYPGGQHSYPSTTSSMNSLTGALVDPSSDYPNEAAQFEQFAGYELHPTYSSANEDYVHPHYQSTSEWTGLVIENESYYDTNTES